MSAKKKVTLGNYYIVEFRRQGRPPATRLMDVACAKWISKVKKNVYCQFPESVATETEAQKHSQRLKKLCEPLPQWKKYLVQLWGKDGKYLLNLS